MFRLILDELLVTTHGALAALFLDFEGETVELVCDRDLSDHDLRILGAYQGIFLDAAAHALRERRRRRAAALQDRSSREMARAQLRREGRLLRGPARRQLVQRGHGLAAAGKVPGEVARGDVTSVIPSVSRGTWAGGASRTCLAPRPPGSLDSRSG